LTRPDLLISVAAADHAWGAWVSWHLEKAGYTVRFDQWDTTAGENRVLRRSRDLSDASALLAMFSPEYFDDPACLADLAAVHDLHEDRIIPVVVADCQPPLPWNALATVSLIGLDADQARRALLRAAARTGYRPVRPPGFPGSAVPEPPFPLTQTDAAVEWEEQGEIELGGVKYLLHEVETVFSPRRSAVVRQGRASELPRSSADVWLKQVRVLRRTDDAVRILHGVAEEGRLIEKLTPTDGVPQLLRAHRDRDESTLVLHRGWVWTLSQAYGPSSRPLDITRGTAMIKALRPVCTALRKLHLRGLAHRALTPDSILVHRAGRRAALRDLGLATLPALPGEGPAVYRAPEQEHPLRYQAPNQTSGQAAVDVYQLAAIIYHVLAGFPPAMTGQPVPLSGPLGFPPAADQLIRRCLDPEPSRREHDIERFHKKLNTILARSVGAGSGSGSGSGGWVGSR
jgi:hypothetical protein